ncbi:hypothetical protein ACB098_05G073600 [Castanea mollissima]
MNSAYSSIPKRSYLELQSHNDSQNLRSPPITHVNLVPFDDEEGVGNGYLHSSTGLHNDDGFDEDLGPEFDSHPLIDTGSKTGSGISGAVFNLTTTIIGAGIMALPAAMKVLGLVLGIFVIVLMGLLSEYSVELLVKFSVLVKASSYGEVVQHALGRPAKVLSEICIIVNNAGVLIVYLIIMGDVMSGSLNHIGVFDQWLGHGVWDHRKLLILVIVVLLLAPLCALERIESLSLTSAASVALAVLFVVVACVIAFIKLVEGKIESPRIGPDFGSKKAILDLLVVVPIMTNAYVCHFNVQPIYNELEGRTPQKMNRGTESDVLTNFDKNLGIRFSSELNYIVRVGYIFHLVLVFPVVHFSLRQTVDALLFEGSAPLLESRKRSLGLTAVLLVLIYFGSTMIPNIWTAFKVTGATTAVSLGFIFPSLIALRLGQQRGCLSFGEKFLSRLMLVFAILVGIFGMFGNIYSIESQSE